MTKVAEFVQLLQKGRKPFPVGTVRTGKDGIKRRKAANGSWVPVKKRKEYKAGDVRTKDGKRYRMGDDGKWRRTRVRVVGKGAKKKETDWAREEGSMGKPKTSKPTPKPKKKAAGDLLTPKQRIEQQKQVLEMVERLRGHGWDNELLRNIHNHAQNPDYRDTDFMKLGVSQYVNSDASFTNLNEQLRAGQSVESMNQYYTDMYTDIVDEMKPLSQDMKLFRGVTVDFDESDSIPVDSFLSTTTIKSVGLDMASGDHEAVPLTFFVIDVPKGADSIVTNALQGEVIFPPKKYKLSVTKSDRISRPYPHRWPIRGESGPTQKIKVLHCKLVENADS